MMTRTFAPLGAVLVAGVLGATLSASALAATDVAVTDFQGAWSGAVTYAPGAIVTFQGATYICTAQNTQFGPATHPNFWKVLAPAAGTGATGPAGPPGPQGAAGPPGPPGNPGTNAAAVAANVQDSNSALVGTVVDGQLDIAMRLNGKTYLTVQGQGGVLPDGSGFKVNPITFFHTSPDCSGTRYLSGFAFGPSGGALSAFTTIGPGTAGHPTAYLPIYPASPLLSGSTEIFQPGQDTSVVSGCNSQSQSLPNAVTFTTADLSGYVPPFSIQ